MTSSLTRIAAGTFVAGITTLGVAAPAQAQQPSNPDGPGSLVTVSTDTGGGWELAQLATGALGGIVIAGAGVAAAAGLRHRHAHATHAA